MTFVASVLAEIVTIGDELTRGETVDTNSAFLAGRLTELGVCSVGWLTSCRDVRADIADALVRAASRAKIVLVSGGLGPTEDDLTVDVAAELAGVEPVVDEPSRERMERRFARANFKLTPNNIRQVRVPSGARVFDNRNGLAPGFEIALRGAAVFFMPGIPREMSRLCDEQIIPRIAELLAGAPRVLRRIWRVFGVGESHVDDRLSGLLAAVDPGAPADSASLHFNVQFPEVLVKVIARDADEARARERLDRLGTEIRTRLGDAVYGEGDDGLPVAVGAALRGRGATVALAESCTGGLIGHLLTEVPGSSEYFKLGMVLYANEEKVARLGVSEATLAQHGAVSRECVEEMARAVRDLAGATYGVAVSGIAGPSGGTPDKPVGTVHLAVASMSEVHAKVLSYPGTRSQVKQLAAHWALKLLLTEASKQS